jgi:hypothetical protein
MEGWAASSAVIKHSPSNKKFYTLLLDLCGCPIVSLWRNSTRRSDLSISQNISQSVLDFFQIRQFLTRDSPLCQGWAVSSIVSKR